jgi:nicotinate-nucleotide adenylyltransferase
MTASPLHKVPHRPRRVAVFGGSFDPVHVGHLAVARSAQRRFHLDEVHFVLAGRPPHKSKREMAPYPERYAMLALACAEHPHFLPSLAEGGDDLSGRHTAYSVDTVRRFRHQLRHPHDQLYFIVGADQFLEIPTWRDYETLLGLCDFIVVSRPGFRLQALRLVIPPELLARPAAGAPRDRGTIALRRSTVHLLDRVASHVSATEIRRRRQRHQPIHGLVPARVEEYIIRQALYS